MPLFILDEKMIKTGDLLPKFELMNQNNQLIRIHDYVGKYNLVVYFYPKDDTPGCTKEACSFRDYFEDFVEAGAMVIGISSDDPVTHTRFANKYKLPFTLLSDSENRVRELFGVPKNFLGLIPGRVTYVIDKEGIVRRVFNSQINAQKHVQEAMEELKQIQ